MDAATRSDARRRRELEHLSSLGVIALGSAAIVVLGAGAGEPIAPRLMIKPMLAMAALTFAVLLSLYLWRNVVVATGKVSATYYLDYQTNPPAEWIERPSRVFNNLMQVPTLFYVISLLTLVTPWADSVELRLAWIYVALRGAHSAIYLLFNALPWRAASFVLSVVALMAMWARYAALAL